MHQKGRSLIVASELESKLSMRWLVRDMCSDQINIKRQRRKLGERERVIVICLGVNSVNISFSNISILLNSHVGYPFISFSPLQWYAMLWLSSHQLNKCPPPWLTTFVFEKEIHFESSSYIKNKPWCITSERLLVYYFEVVHPCVSHTTDLVCILLIQSCWLIGAMRHLFI